MQKEDSHNFDANICLCVSRWYLHWMDLYRCAFVFNLKLIFTTRKLVYVLSKNRYTSTKSRRSLKEKLWHFRKLLQTSFFIYCKLCWYRMQWIVLTSPIIQLTYIFYDIIHITNRSLVRYKDAYITINISCIYNVAHRDRFGSYDSPLISPPICRRPLSRLLLLMIVLVNWSLRC